MRRRLTRALCFWLLLSGVPLAGSPHDGPPSDGGQQAGTSTKASAATRQKSEPTGNGSAAKKNPEGGTSTKKKPERNRTGTAKKKPDRDAALAMEPGIVCKSIDGYEDFEPLPEAAQTSEEKLLVYIRPFGFQTQKVKGAIEGHLTADGELRKRGAKAILRQKKKLLDFKPRAPTYPRYVYLKSSVSLKGLAPGDYDLTIILHDEIAKGTPASQVVKFRVIPPKDPRKADGPSTPME